MKGLIPKKKIPKYQLQLNNKTTHLRILEHGSFLDLRYGWIKIW